MYRPGPDPKPEPRPKKTPKYISRKSKKQAKEDGKYSKDAKAFLEGVVCLCCNESDATTVHHKKGREGFADQWALLRGITLLHDRRYWVACCGFCHTEIEANPTWAMENGYTLIRADIIVK